MTATKSTEPPRFLKDFSAGQVQAWKAPDGDVSIHIGAFAGIKKSGTPAYFHVGFNMSRLDAVALIDALREAVSFVEHSTRGPAEMVAADLGL